MRTCPLTSRGVWHIQASNLVTYCTPKDSAPVSSWHNKHNAPIAYELLHGMPCRYSVVMRGPGDGSTCVSLETAALLYVTQWFNVHTLLQPIAKVEPVWAGEESGTVHHTYHNMHLGTTILLFHAGIQVSTVHRSVPQYLCSFL